LVALPYYLKYLITRRHVIIANNLPKKILKAYIIAKENILIKIHDLDDLIDKCEKHNPEFGEFKEACENLTLYTTVRYPPFGNLTEQDMMQALKDAQNVLGFTMSKLAEMGFEVS
jgi:HEPN domain-containing protein